MNCKTFKAKFYRFDSFYGITFQSTLEEKDRIFAFFITNPRLLEIIWDRKKLKFRGPRFNFEITFPELHKDAN